MKVVVISLLVAVVAANGPAYKLTYPAPAYPESKRYPAPASYSKPSYSAPSYGKSYDYAPMPYSFAWGVKDDYSYNNYAHQETSDDKGYVTGSYRVLLPDGRTQIVTYRADDYTGFVADVKYEGVAKYDDYKPAYEPTYTAEYKPTSQPEYKPTYKPSYKPEYKPEYKPAYKPAYPAPAPYQAAPSYPSAKPSAYPARQYSSRY